MKCLLCCLNQFGTTHLQNTTANFAHNFPHAGMSFNVVFNLHILNISDEVVILQTNTMNFFPNLERLLKIGAVKGVV